MTWLVIASVADLAYCLGGARALRAQPASEVSPAHAGAPGTIDAQPAAAGAAPNVTETPDTPWSQGVPPHRRALGRDLFLEGNRLFRALL